MICHPQLQDAGLCQNAIRLTCLLREAEDVEAFDGRATLNLCRIELWVFTPASQQLHADHVARRWRAER